MMFVVGRLFIIQYNIEISRFIDENNKDNRNKRHLVRSYPFLLFLFVKVMKSQYYEVQ